MDKPVVRATQLEQYRRFVSGKYEYMTEQDVIDSVTGTFEGNFKTRIGSALHKLVEHAAALSGNIHYDVPEGVRQYTYYGTPITEHLPIGMSVDIDGFHVVFDAAQVATILSYANEHPSAFHEFRDIADYGPAFITGCADMIDGTGVRDIKTKFSAPDDNDYLDSIQWRVYCDIFGATNFCFDLFEFKDYKEERHSYDVRGLKLIRHEPIVCYPYPAIHAEIKSLLTDFIDWSNRKGIINHLFNK